jgi:hypothetical protein
MKHIKTFESFSSTELIEEGLFSNPKKKFEEQINAIKNGTFIYGGNTSDKTGLQGGMPAEAPLAKGVIKYTGNVKLDPKFKSIDELIAHAEKTKFEHPLKFVKGKDGLIFTYAETVQTGSATGHGKSGGTAG